MINSSAKNMRLYATTVFLSAFLLFQVQPLVAKIILPWFGGSAAVWTGCMLFFQVLLLLGYFYAHGSIRWQAPRRARLVHWGLLIPPGGGVPPPPPGAG